MREDLLATGHTCKVRGYLLVLFFPANGWRLVLPDRLLGFILDALMTMKVSRVYVRQKQENFV